MTELPPKYSPKEVEEKWYKLWEQNKLFSGEADKDKQPYCIVIPPPNITGILHMGHALNNTIQDILIRYHRMNGMEALWVPGTDHAGIATQNVVERKLAQEGKKRHDLGREKFVEEVWKWRKDYGSTIIKQLKKLGCSCDWDRERFTMDEGLSNAVLEAFVRLYEKGLIYQGNYIINWCPRCQTALSDEEAQHKELNGHLYYIKYPVKGSKEHIMVATTRPETMLGDTAVAVNPDDKRYKDLQGKTVILPIVEREIKVITDEMVDPKFGTGIVKVTPAHDPNDFLMGKKHGLEFVNVMNPDGTMNKNAGEYDGMDRFECREALLEDLKERKLLEKVEPHNLSIGHCYRCHTIVEPYMSKQWFVKMKPLAQPAIKAVKDGDIKFYPSRWTKVYLDWMENIRDWCISRQIWWGHRLPVYYCKKCLKQASELTVDSLQLTEKKGIIVSKTKPAKCPACGSSDIEQDPDVLDTWFSSWLWPFSVFNWPKQNQDLEYFYPTSSLVTAQEIIFFWVARMIMAGYEFMGDKPFSDVYIHGTVRDETGTKMSKSLGNIIDPLEIIEQYGTDALRFSLISITAVGQDVFLSKEKFELGRNFANKIWNASRFALTNLAQEPNGFIRKPFHREELPLASKWILSRLHKTIKEVDESVKKYRFNDAANLLYEFIWHEFCDWYIEISKPLLLAKDELTKEAIYIVLESSLRMLHPIMPFITEEIWQKLPHEGDSIMAAPWPAHDEKFIDEEIENSMKLIQAATIAIRNIRAEMNVPLPKKCSIVVTSKKQHVLSVLEKHKDYMFDLAKIENIQFGKDLKRPKNSVVAVLEDAEIFVLLEGIIDIPTEKNRLTKQIEKAESDMKGIEARLKNKEFVAKAPADVVEKQKAQVEALKESVKKLKENLKALE